MKIIRNVEWCGLFIACLAGALAGCNDDPTMARVDNAFAIAGDAPSTTTMTVYKAWWVTTLFPNPIPAGASSESERTIPATDFAYVLLAPGWTPDMGGRPPRLIAAKSAAKLSVPVHDLLHIVVSDATFVGNCAAGKTLGTEDARLIVERIFPGDFTGLVYDPATCTATARPDGSADLDAAAADGGPQDAAVDLQPDLRSDLAGGDGSSVD
jgi:hypothetical protein